MMDYIEYNLRRVVIENTSFCSHRCHLFDDLMTKPVTEPPTAVVWTGDAVQEEKPDEKKMFSCFEKCLGKFSDSYDSSLDLFGAHLHTLTEKKVFNHSKNDDS